eukprot:4969452-Prymnesium_polylepis.1
MYSDPSITPYPTIRLPLLRYSSLLNGPNQETEDPASLLRSHIKSENASPNPPVPLFHRKTTVTTADEPDPELEILGRCAAPRARLGATPAQQHTHLSR